MYIYLYCPYVQEVEIRVADIHSRDGEEHDMT